MISVFLCVPVVKNTYRDYSPLKKIDISLSQYNKPLPGTVVL